MSGRKLLFIDSLFLAGLIGGFIIGLLIGLGIMLTAIEAAA